MRAEDELAFGYYDDGESRRSARRRVRQPGLMLIICGALGLVIELASIACAVIQPELGYEVMKAFANAEAMPQQREVALAQVERDRDHYRLDAPQYLGLLALGAILNLFMVIGGVKMRRLETYALSVMGSIFAMIPLQGCTVLSLPIGLWAMVVLANEHVRSAFARKSGRR